MIDPRLSVLEQRLRGVDRIVAVTGGKGGIGKSVLSSLLALTLADGGRRVGLLDLDLTGPCDHLILGIEPRFPEEPHGVEPPLHAGIRFMSVSLFGGASPAPLRGVELTGAILELLAITLWGELDVLVVDMPPGIADTALDAIRLLPRAEYLAVTTSSTVVLQTVRRTLALLRELRAPIRGVVENMARDGSEDAAVLASEFDLRLLGRVPHDPELERALGNPQRLLDTDAARAVAGLSVFSRSGGAARR
jgi:ATP-binding protein involved in chromosome partitioning